MGGLTLKIHGLLALLAFFTSIAANIAFADISEKTNNKGSDAAIHLYMPERSENGSFVIKVDHSELIMNEEETKIELWRSYNGGEFELISAHPQFNAISQMVYKQGTYAYQARLVHWQNGEKIADNVSKTSYIKVNLRYPTTYMRSHLQASR